MECCFWAFGTGLCRRFLLKRCYSRFACSLGHLLWHQTPGCLTFVPRPAQSEREHKVSVCLCGSPACRDSLLYLVNRDSGPLHQVRPQSLGRDDAHGRRHAAGQAADWSSAVCPTAAGCKARKQPASRQQGTSQREALCRAAAVASPRPHVPCRSTPRPTTPSWTAPSCCCASRQTASWQGPTRSGCRGTAVATGC